MLEATHPEPSTAQLERAPSVVEAALDAVEGVLRNHPGAPVKAALRLMAVAGWVNEHELRHVLQLDAPDASELFDRLRRLEVVRTSQAGLSLHPIVHAAVLTDVLLRDPFAARGLVERMLEPLDAALAWSGAPRDRALAQLAAVIAAAPATASIPSASEEVCLSVARRAWGLAALPTRAAPEPPAAPLDDEPEVAEVYDAFRNLGDPLWLGRSRLGERLFGGLGVDARAEALHAWLEAGIRAAGATRRGDRVERAMRAGFSGSRSNDEAAAVAGMSLATFKRHRRWGVEYVHQLLLQELSSASSAATARRLSEERPTERRMASLQP